MKPTYEELERENIELKKAIAFLEKRINELERLLGVNSKNSSKPPSSDQKKNLEPPHGGAKPGHKGVCRALVPEEQVSRVVRSNLDACPACGSKDLHKRRPWIVQQVDLPEIKVQVTQIECDRVCCRSCGRRATADFPEEYEPHAFGPRLAAFVGLLTSAYRMSKRSVRNLLNTAFNVKLSLGVIPTIEDRLSQALRKPDALLLKTAQASPAYIDETSFREKAKNCYVWTISTAMLSVLRILPSRSLKSMNEIRSRDSKQITVTDRYATYSFSKHQYCLCHLKRDFVRFSEGATRDGPIAERLLFELSEIFRANSLYRQNVFGLARMRAAVGYRKRRLQTLLKDACCDGSDRLVKFAGKLLKQWHRLFLFTRYPQIEPTNNIAERALRHIVLWRKTSYGTQSLAGSRFIERAISLWMTLQKQGRDPFEFFIQAYRARTCPELAPTLFL